MVIRQQLVGSSNLLELLLGERVVGVQVRVILLCLATVVTSGGQHYGGVSNKVLRREEVVDARLTSRPV